MTATPKTPRALLRRLWQPTHGSPSVFSTAGSFSAPVGSHVGNGTVRGYYVDFSFKPQAPSWPPPWFVPGGRLLYVAVAQWGLGCFERYLAGEGPQWLAAAQRAADELVREQQPDGSMAGGWIHRFDHRHTFPLRAPWLSGMAQGEGASLLVRVAGETGADRYAEAARLALGPMRVPSAAGGVGATLGGRFFPEEYPTDPPSLVLNGGIFALWGCYDVGLGLGDASAASLFDEGAGGLAQSLHLYDTGYWSRYDLFPHPLKNVASAAYHQLHIDQLRAMALIDQAPEWAATAARFARYADSRGRSARAFASKVAFRLLVPRNRLLAHRLPWAGARSP